MLGRIASTYEADPELRRELQQEILLAVWRALPAFRGEASLRTFLARVAHNRSISHVAAQATRPRTVELQPDLVSVGATPQEDAERHDRRRRLLAAILGLPLAWRQPVSLTLEGFTPKEIGEVLGISANVVSIRLSRAKTVLKERMSEGE
jgi:RNA polymerase sigma-70 factor (ECF subfamily)